MKRYNVYVAVFLSMAVLLGGCASMNNTTKGGLLGAGGGAAVGAGVGALFGKGKGAAIGAAAGGMGGLRARRHGRAAAEQQADAEADAKEQELMNNFKKAFTACITGKGYTVQ